MINVALVKIALFPVRIFALGGGFFINELLGHFRRHVKYDIEVGTGDLENVVFKIVQPFEIFDPACAVGDLSALMAGVRRNIAV